MSEVLQLVLAADVASVGELRRFGEADADATPFEPGLFALRVLGASILGNPSPLDDAEAGLLTVDGPPDPVRDEGVFLYRLSDPVVETIATWTQDGRREAAERWSSAIARYDAPRGGLARLGPPLYALADLAKMAVQSGKKIYVRKLER